MATERIQILITEKGTRRVVREVARIGTSADKSASSVGFLKKALLTIGAAAVLRQLVQMSDAFIQVENRLKLVTSSTEQLRQVQEALFEVSNRTRSSFEATAELYARVALSAKNLGVTQQEVLDFTEALNAAVILSGATAQEARNGIIQFAQGLASNRLAGDELRAVLEQLPLVADVIAKQMGVTRGSLRELASQGKITGKTILEAFNPIERAELLEKFNKTIPTVAQSLTVLRNKLIQFLGELNRGTGVFSAFAGAIAFVSKNFKRFAVGILGALVIPAIIGVIAAVSALTAALIANPFTAIIAALSIAIGLLAAFQDQIFLSEGSLTTLGDVVISLGIEFGIVFGDMFVVVQSLLVEVGLLSDGVDVSLRSILQFAAQTADGFLGVFLGLFFALGRIFQGLPALIGSGMKAALNALVGLVELTINLNIRAINELTIGAIIQINKLLDVANRASESLGRGPLFDLISAKGVRIENVDLGRLENNFADVTTGFSDAVVGGFKEGFEKVTGVQDLLDKALGRADERAAGRITGGKGENLLDQPPPGDDGAREDLAAIALRQRLELLEREGVLVSQSIGLTTQQTDVRQQLFKIEEQLRRKGVELNETQRAQIQTALTQNQALKSQAEILGRLRDSAQDAGFQIENLRKLFQDGKISVSEFADEFRRLRTQELSNNKDVFSGFERGLLSIQDTISDFGAQAEKTLVNAFSGAEDALVSFVQTGEVNFSGLVDSILADLTRLLARQALFALISSFGGPGAAAGASAGASFGGQRARGGPVRPDQSFLVGERGPEIFQPSGSGNIVPNSQVGQAAPQVNVQVINVSDPNEVSNALNDPSVQEQVVNVIRRNARAVKSALGV